MTKVFEQTWWNTNLKSSGKFNEYLGWLGTKEADSRIFIRDNIKDLEIKSVADFGCGPCVDYFALKSEDYEIEYLGIDSCVHLKEYNESRGVNFLNSPVENTGLEENSYEMSYSRHVLEHLPTYKDCLSEMIRVAEKYVVHIFFIKPGSEEKIDHWEQENLYHNHYNKEEIETFLINNEKVSSLEWLEINDKENALVITLVSSDN